MNKEQLRKYMQTVYPMSDEKVCSLTEDFEYFSFLKNEFLLNENKINKQSYFLEAGYIRSFTLDKDGQEVTTNIYAAPCFVNDFLAFFKQQPAKENFQALTKCEGWTITFDAVEKNFHNSPEFREFGRILVLFHYDLLQKRMLGMIKDTAENRYIKLCSKHPDVFQNVSLKVIASYLGITDTSLSRLRKGLSHK
jgi:CRP-like cAMP-binding protein